MFSVVCRWVVKKVVHHHRPRVWHRVARHVAAHKTISAGSATFVCTVVGGAAWLRGMPEGYGSPAPITPPVPAGSLGGFQPGYVSDSGFAFSTPGIEFAPDIGPGVIISEAPVQFQPPDTVIPIVSTPNFPVTEIPVGNQPVPEPSTLVLLASALVLIVLVRRLT